MSTYRPDGIDFILLKVRTDLEHTPPRLAPVLRVDRLHMASILSYVNHLEDRVLELQQEMEDRVLELQQEMEDNELDENSRR